MQKALNNVFLAHNYPLKTIEEVRVSVGNGVGKLVERLLPAGMENENYSRILLEFCAEYDKISGELTRP